MEAGVSPSSPPAEKPSTAWIWLIPLCGIVAWWIRDLSNQWAALVEYRFGWVVVMLTAYLAWERWPTRPPQDQPTSLVRGLLPAVFGFGAVLVAELYRIGIARTPSSSFLLSIGCALFVVATLLLGFGPKTTRHFLFPLLFFFVAVPLPKLFWNPIVLTLQAFVTHVNVEVLNLMGIPAVQMGNVIRLPKTTVGVDEACSGIRSLQSSVMAALFVGDLVLRRRGWKVFFLFAGIGLAIVGNCGRSLYLSLTAHRSGADALNAVHDSAGWSVLLFTAVGIALLAMFVTRLERRLARTLPVRPA
jgi:exosortase